jgi:hypothetical protein
MDIETRREKIRQAKKCLFWAIQELPEPLRSMNEREICLRLALDRDLGKILDDLDLGRIDDPR